MRNHRVLKVAARSITLLIQPDETIPSTVLERITSAGHQAVTHGSDRGHILRGNTVATEALIFILHAGNGIAIGNALLNACSRSHIRDIPRGTSQDTHTAVIVLGTSEPLPLMTTGEIGVVMQRLANFSWRATTAHKLSIIWARLDWVAAWEGIEPTVDLLVNRALENAAVGNIIGLEGNRLALGDITTAVIASVDGVLENANVPAVKLR